jgi:hypothetical protein
VLCSATTEILAENCTWHRQSLGLESACIVYSLPKLEENPKTFLNQKDQFSGVL